MKRRVYEVVNDGKGYHAIHILNGQPLSTTIRTPSLWRMKAALERVNPDLVIVSQRMEGNKWLFTLEGEE